MFCFPVSADLTLRLVEDQHAEPLFALVERNRDSLREWLPWVDNSRSIDDTREFIRGARELYGGGNGFSAGLWYSGQLAGMIGLHRIDWLNRKVSLGYWLDSSFRGRGLVTQACRAVVSHCFADLKLNRVEIHCGVGNQRSRAIPERLGFVQEGVMRQAQRVNDRYIDIVVYAMLAAHWHPSSQQVERLL